MRILKNDGSALEQTDEGKKIFLAAANFMALADDPETDGTVSGVADLVRAAAIKDDEMRIPFTMYTEAPMRDGHVFSVAGNSLDPWGKNGIPFLDSHGQGPFALGSMADVTKDKGGDFAAMIGDGVFSKDPKHPTAAVIFGLYRDGHQKAGSQAWQVISARPRNMAKESTGPNDTAETYATCWAEPMKFENTRTLEFSACPVGRHMSAMVRKASGAAGEAELEEQLAAICRGVVGYNGGKNLKVDDVKRLVKATMGYLFDGAKKLAEPEPEPKVLTPQNRYANLTKEQFVFLATTIPEKLMKDFGITGGAK